MPSLTDIASQVRRDILRMVHTSNSGHPGGSLGCTDLLTALYFQIMKHNPQFNMEAKDEDVFILSNGHISPVFYSVLARSGYFDIKEMATFRKINSRTLDDIHKETRDSRLVVPSHLQNTILADRFFGRRIKDMDRIHIKGDSGLLANAQL